MNGSNIRLIALTKGDDDCFKCPLTKIIQGCNVYPSVWRRVAFARTWAGWLVAAARMIAVLKSLLPSGRVKK